MLVVPRLAVLVVIRVTLVSCTVMVVVILVVRWVLRVSILAVLLVVLVMMGAVMVVMGGVRVTAVLSTVALMQIVTPGTQCCVRESAGGSGGAGVQTMVIFG